MAISMRPRSRELTIFLYILRAVSLLMGHTPTANVFLRVLCLSAATSSFEFQHDDVIKWKHFPRYWPFARGIHRFPVNSPHKGQWRGSFMFSLISAWINGWVNNREAGYLRRPLGHYDVRIMHFHPRQLTISWMALMVCVPIFFLNHIVHLKLQTIPDFLFYIHVISSYQSAMIMCPTWDRNKRMFYHVSCVEYCCGNPKSFVRYAYSLPIYVHVYCSIDLVRMVSNICNLW